MFGKDAEKLSARIKTSIIGATGYAGEELTRLLFAHPGAEIVSVVSKSFAGKRLGDIYANYAHSDLVLDGDFDEALDSDCVFLCLPHGESMKAARVFLDAGCKVIDLSGDFRYTDTAIYEEWYGLAHTEQALNVEAVYGLPEYNRSAVQKSRFIANPGCYTTTAILALAPLLKAGVIRPGGIVIDAKSGVSGAGRKESLAFSFCETMDNFKAYSAIRHRHTSEIEEQLGLLAGADVTLLFTPHLLPVKRGILETIYVDIAEGKGMADIEAAYLEAYGAEPFTHVLPKGTLPELKQVVGSNHCMIGFDVSERTGKAVLVSCTDNLLKGAAGQAVQNFNIIYGFQETEGLTQTAWYL